MAVNDLLLTQPAEVGDVPRTWLVAPLKTFVLRVTYGFTNPMPTTDDGPYMVTAKDIHDGRIDYTSARHTSWDAYKNDVTDKSRPRVGDVLLTKDGSIGRVAVCDRPDVCINQSVALIQPSETTDSRFLKYLLETPHYQTRMEGDADGTTIKHIYITRVDKMEVAVPPIEEQCAIVHILGTLDDKIELNRRINETLEAMARAIFKSWFVDFDPVRAKSEGRDIGLPKHIADLFPDRFEESELGKIPARWKVWRVADVGSVICGKTPSTMVAQYYGDDIPFTTIPDMHGKIFATNVERKLSFAGADSQKNKMLPAGAICVSCIATPGLVVITSEPSQTNQQINSIVPSSAHETYFWYWVFRGLGDEIRAGGSGGSVLNNLSTGRFAELRVLAPPAELRNLYHSCVAPLFDRILTNEQAAKTLAAVRDALLPRLISGELRLEQKVVNSGSLEG